MTFHDFSVWLIISQSYWCLNINAVFSARKTHVLAGDVNRLNWLLIQDLQDHVTAGHVGIHQVLLSDSPVEAMGMDTDGLMIEGCGDLCSEAPLFEKQGH